MVLFVKQVEQESRVVQKYVFLFVFLNKGMQTANSLQLHIQQPQKLFEHLRKIKNKKSTNVFELSNKSSSVIYLKEIHSEQFLSKEFHKICLLGFIHCYFSIIFLVLQYLLKFLISYITIFRFSVFMCFCHFYQQFLYIFLKYFHLSSIYFISVLVLVILVPQLYFNQLPRQIF